MQIGNRSFFTTLATALLVPLNAIANGDDLTICELKGRVASFAQTERLARSNIEDTLKISASGKLSDALKQAMGGRFPTRPPDVIYAGVIQEVYQRSEPYPGDIIGAAYYDECIASYLKKR
jgi:hypothetical protein